MQLMEHGDAEVFIFHLYSSVFYCDFDGHLDKSSSYYRGTRF